ncbi:MAG: cation:proton antiporter [Candidatus Eremiobacteraeota bacterium]|nr:cation:proton antiporter [Candidatus Eremiobacteraeota bacterium]
MAGDLCLIVLGAWLAGLLCHFVRLPMVLGYIAAGVAIGPYTWGPHVAAHEQVEMLADVGVALLLFTVGLEFPLPKLSQVGKVALLGTPLQVLLTIGWGTVLAKICGWPFLQGVWLGALLSLSSTAVVLRCLSQNGVQNTLSARVMIGILVVQDLCSVPLLLILPQLGKAGSSYVELGKTLLIGVLFVAFWLWFGRSLLPYAMRTLASQKNRELFALSVLAFGLGIGYTAHALGLSLAFGAFLAGLVLAESDYAHQALSDVGPLRDLFTLIFFASVGMMIDPRWVLANASLLVPLIAVTWFGKGIILAAIVRAFGYANVVPWACALYLGQMGELAFVIARLGMIAQSIPESVYKVLITIAAVSMTLTPLVAPWTQPLYTLWRKVRPKTVDTLKPNVATSLENHTIVCGYGRVGKVVAATLLAMEMPFVITEIDEKALRRAEKDGHQVLFGDSFAVPVLEAANLHHARNIILTFADILSGELAVNAIYGLKPDAHIVARAAGRDDMEKLCNMGVSRVVVAEMEGALEMVHQCLDQLGLSDVETGKFLEQIRRQHYDALYPEGTDEQLMRLRNTLRKSQSEMFTLESPEWDGLSIAQVNVRGLTGCTVLAIVREENTLVNPGPQEILQHGDRLMILGDPEQRASLRELFGRD